MGTKIHFQIMTVAAFALPALFASITAHAYVTAGSCKTFSASQYSSSWPNTSKGYDGISLPDANGKCNMVTMQPNASCPGKYNVQFVSSYVCGAKAAATAKVKAASPPLAKKPSTTPSPAAVAGTPGTQHSDNPAVKPVATTAQGGNTYNTYLGSDPSAKKAAEPKTSDWTDPLTKETGYQVVTNTKDGGTKTEYFTGGSAKDGGGKSAYTEFNGGDADTPKNTNSYSTVNSAGRQVTSTNADRIGSMSADGTMTITRNGQDIVVDAKTGKPKEASSKSDFTKEERKAAFSDECSSSQMAILEYNKTHPGAYDVSKFKCSPTNTIVKAVTVGNQVAQSAGTMAMNMIGNQIIANAQTGTQSAAQKGVAKAAGTMEKYQTALTMLNTAATARLIQQTSQHKRNAADIQSIQVGAEDDDANKDCRTANCFGSAKDTRTQSRLDAAYTEQKNAQKTASAATEKAITSTIQAALAAKTAKIQQKGAEKAAHDWKSIEDASNKQGVLWDSAATVPTTGGDPNAPTTNAASGDASQSVSDVATETDSPNTLGDGKDLGAQVAGPSGPAPGNFKAAAGGGGAPGGSSGGAGGGASTSGGASNTTDDPKAAYASEFGTKERYETGGGPSGGKAGGAGGAGKKDEGGIDLNGLLAQFLPKTEEDMPNKHGILDFANGGGRAPASAEENASFLDKNADLFQRIHETMSEKNRKGHVGI